MIVGAATLSVRGVEVLAPLGEGVLEVLLDTAGDEINAVEGTLRFSGDSVRVQGVEDGGSPLSFWLVPPTFGERDVRFSGVVPGGISGDAVVLFRIITEGVRVGTSTVSLVDTQVLRNDGSGTSVELSAIPHTITVSTDVPRTVYDPNDVIPPGAFIVTLTRSPALGGGWMAVFAAEDKETGIAYYEAQESLWGNVDETAWERVTSPYELSDQWRAHYLFVKAVDRNGNSTITSVSPGLNRVFVLFGVGVLVCGAVWLLYTLARRLKRRRGQETLPAPPYM
jgi:hypothetical protein